IAIRWGLRSVNSDFKIQRNTVSIPTSATTATITAGTDYTAPASSTRAFLWTPSSNYWGSETAGLTATADAVMASVTNHSNILTNQIFTRGSADANHSINIAWEI